MRKRIAAMLTGVFLLFLLTACSNLNTGSAVNETETESYEVDAQAATLTIAGQGSETVVYTAEAFQEMELETHQYSGRNKTVENTRIFKTYTGIDLKTILKESGFEEDGAIIQVVCSDGYTREYVVEDLYGLYSFKDNETDDKEEVNPMLVVQEDEDLEYPSRFMLVYGQQDYDTNDTMDFNMQGWLSYIQYIEVSYQE